MMADNAASQSLAAVANYDIREMSFQNVVDRILRPSGIKMGGFPMEMFVDLTDAEQQKFMCNICYMIANELRYCDNKHIFCRSCIRAWSMTFGENSQKCPFCRCDQTEYQVDKDLEDQLKEKVVCCRADGCSYKAPLRFFLLHSHGRINYSNADVDFSRIQAEQHRLFALPSLAALEDTDNVAAGAVDIREQLLQGRMMIHQMMLLMHLEMQLRQQALISYQEARDPAQRMQRLDDVMALNEQLNEVGSILGILLNTPLDRVASMRQTATTSNTLSQPRASHHDLTGHFGASVPGESTSLPRFRFHALDTDTDTDDDDDDDDEVSFAVSNAAAADDDDDVHDEVDDDYSQTGASASSSMRNSYNSDISTSSRHHPARITFRHTMNAERVSAVGASASTPVNTGISHPAVVSGSDLLAPTSMASNGYSSVLLSHRRQRPATPRWTAAEQSPTSVVVNDLHSSAGDQSHATVRTTQSQTVTLPQIQSGGLIAASQMNVGHVRPAVVGRQLTVSDTSAGTPRQLEPVSGNRSFGAANSNTTVVTSSQTLPAMSRVVPSTSRGATGVSASHQVDNSLESANTSSVVTEPWPVLSTAEPRTSTLASTNRLAVGQPAGRLSHGHGGGLTRNSTNTDNHHVDADRRPAGAVAHGPRRTVPNSGPPLQLHRSSVRNSLSRPAGPASVSTFRQGTIPHRMVPLPHPAVRTTRQQSLSDRSTATSRNFAPSNDVLRPRRRSEIAHEIMFPPQKDMEQ